MIECDTVVVCAGQSERNDLAEDLLKLGVEAEIIGGAELATELDAKRAIGQGARLAAAI